MTSSRVNLGTWGLNTEVKEIMGLNRGQRLNTEVKEETRGLNRYQGTRLRELIEVKVQ